MSKKLFFSYGHDEYTKYVEKIRDYLEEKGYNVFFDEDELQGSADWELKLEEGLKDKDKVIFFITPHSARRPDGYCLNELAMALTYKRVIVPVMLKYEVPPLSIIRQQYLNMENCFSEYGLDEGLFLKHMENLLLVLDGEKELDFEGVQAKVFNELNPLDTTSDFAKHKHIVGREWIVDEIDNWVDKYPESKVLWVTAEAGYGKSALAVYLANNHPDVAGIHFCNYNRPITKDAKQVVKTLVYHLYSRQLDGYFDDIKYVDTKEKNAAELFNDLIANPLNRTQYNDEKNLFIIIDAIDETLDDPKEELLDLLGSYEFEVGLPAFVKIIIISRPDDRIRETLSGLDPLELDVHAKMNEKDCKNFIMFRLEQLKWNKNKIDTELIEEILDNSSANMLYLNKFFEEVEKRNIDLNEPKTFPKGLNGIYKGFVKRVTIDETEYDTTYATILEVILAYGEAIPRLLLRDILDMNIKQFNRLITNLGSILKESNGILDIYHKSFKDWLVNEKDNKKYFINIEEGNRKIQYFIKSLSVKIYEYKKEYILFDQINTKLINLIYKNNNNLKDFFKILNFIDVKTKIEKLNILGNEYYRYNEMYKAIEIQEWIYKTTKNLYLKSPENWVENYILVLKDLANSYRITNRVPEAIDLGIQSLSMLKELYEKNPEQWADDYSAVLGNLASSYRIMNRVPEAIELEMQNLSILKELYEDNPEQWADHYTVALKSLGLSYKNSNRIPEAIKLEMQSLSILKELHEENPKQWADGYSAVLGNLANSYRISNRVPEAIELEMQSLSILKELYEENPQQWGDHYTRSLIALALLYRMSNRVSEAIELAMQSLSILKGLYEENPQQWANHYTIALTNLANSYRISNRVPEAVELEMQSLSILKELYEDNPDHWANYYTDALGNLAISYKKSNRVTEAIKLEMQSLSILKELYEENPKQWVGDYTGVCINLASSYKESNRVTEAIELEMQSLSILKGLYEENPQIWVSSYMALLKNLAITYKKSNRVPEAIELEMQSLSILKELYEKNPNEWVGDYIGVCINLASSYRSSNRVTEAIELDMQSLSMLKEFYEENPQMWAAHYTMILKNLAISYKKSHMLAEAIKLETQVVAILRKLYEENPQQWAEGYMEALNGLNQSNRMNGTISIETIKLIDTSLSIQKELCKNTLKLSAFRCMSLRLVGQLVKMMLFFLKNEDIKSDKTKI